MRTILVEALAVALAGALLGFAVNALSPKGISVSRNYFPQIRMAPGSATNAPVIGSAPATNVISPALSHLTAMGIELVDSNYVAKAFHDPARLQNLLIFIDAREDAQFQQGHVPGAYQLDYYRPEPHLPMVLPAAQAAETVIIYCNGGNCEDSEFAAVFLKDAGVSVQKLKVYAGGFAEWSTNRMPVEVGAKGSGQVRNP